MDQNVILVETVPLEFDLESLGCRLRIRPGQTKFMDRLSRLAEEAARVARPKAVARLCGLTMLDEENVQVGEVTFSSPLLRQKMDGLGRAFPYLASEGDVYKRQEEISMRIGARGKFIDFWSRAVTGPICFASDFDKRV